MGLVSSFRDALITKNKEDKIEYELNSSLLSKLLGTVFKDPIIAGMIEITYFTGIFRVGGSGLSDANTVSFITPE